MHQQIERRLAELREEFSSGQKVLAELESRRNEVQHTLLRISGAIQVLEEMLNRERGAAAGTPAVVE